MLLRHRLFLALCLVFSTMAAASNEIPMGSCRALFAGEPSERLAGLLRNHAALKRWAEEADSPLWGKAIDVIASNDSVFIRQNFSDGKVSWMLEMRATSGGVEISIPAFRVAGVADKAGVPHLHKEFGRLIGTLLAGIERRAIREGKPVRVTIKPEFVVHPGLREKLRELGFAESRIPDQVAFKVIEKVSYAVGVGAVAALGTQVDPVVGGGAGAVAGMVGLGSRFMSNMFETGRNYSLDFEVRPPTP